MKKMAQKEECSEKQTIHDEREKYSKIRALLDKLSEQEKRKSLLARKEAKTTMKETANRYARQGI